MNGKVQDTRARDRVCANGFANCLVRSLFELSLEYYPGRHPASLGHSFAPLFGYIQRHFVSRVYRLTILGLPRVRPVSPSNDRDVKKPIGDTA